MTTNNSTSTETLLKITNSPGGIDTGSFVTVKGDVMEYLRNHWIEDEIDARNIEISRDGDTFTVAGLEGGRSEMVYEVVNE